MRLLMDGEGLGWDEAWDVTSRCIIFHAVSHYTVVAYMENREVKKHVL